jgi:hypothetical protein
LPRLSMPNKTNGEGQRAADVEFAVMMASPGIKKGPVTGPWGFMSYGSPGSGLIGGRADLDP